jgi:hypothetical protein
MTTTTMTRSRRWLALPLMALGIFVWLRAGRGPHSVPTHLHLGARTPAVEELALRWRRAGADAVMRDVTLRWPAGAPADVYQQPRLPDGEYEVGVRIRQAGGRETSLTRRAIIDGDRPIEIDLTE